MKILLISPTLEGIGGVAQHTRDLIKFLKKINEFSSYFIQSNC